ncbi:MAG: methyltransferase domain-containing protein [Acidobacteria bacterium]|nr:methyltransferase domain-containing protein [Acidobacteriota bacterium]
MTEIIGDITERLLIDAGIGAGMRVLDVGCGRGDVSLLAARLVGEQGKVLGVDRDAVPLAAARTRARDLGLSNANFVEGDLSTFPLEIGLYDAIVGRRVLMYLPDPIAAVRRLASALRPGGLIIFQEHDSAMVPGRLTLLPLHERVHMWIWQTVQREGADIHIGFNLSSVFAQAGLAVEQVRAEAIVQTPKAHYAIGATVRAMLPRIVQQGIATEEEIDIDTLDQRLIEECENTGATFVGDMVFGAWARKPR